MNGACSSKKHISLAPGAQGRGQRLLNFNNKDNFKDFLYQTLLVFLQIKDKKHTVWDFCSDTLVMPQGWDLGVQGLIFNTVMWHIKLAAMMCK